MFNKQSNTTYLPKRKVLQRDVYCPRRTHQHPGTLEGKRPHMRRVRERLGRDPAGTRRRRRRRVEDTRLKIGQSNLFMLRCAPAAMPPSERAAALNPRSRSFDAYVRIPRTGGGRAQRRCYRTRLENLKVCPCSSLKARPVGRPTQLSGLAYVCPLLYSVVTALTRHVVN